MHGIGEKDDSAKIFFTFYYVLLNYVAESKRFTMFLSVFGVIKPAQIRKCTKFLRCWQIYPQVAVFLPSMGYESRSGLR